MSPTQSSVGFFMFDDKLTKESKFQEIALPSSIAPLLFQLTAQKTLQTTRVY